MKKNCSFSKSMMLFLAPLAFLVSCASMKDSATETPEQQKALIYYQQGTEELISKNYTNALNYLLKAKELYPDDSNIRNNLGMAYYLKNQLEKAKVEFQKSLALNSKNSDARNNYASALLAQNKYPEALIEYHKVIEDLTYNKMFRVYFNVALIHKYENRDNLSFDFLNKAITDNPDYCPAHIELGNYHTQKYQFNDALASYKDATKGVCVNEPASHFELAMTLTRLNRLGEAEIKFKEIQTKFPKTRYAILAKEELGRLHDDRQISKNLNYKQKSTNEQNLPSNSHFETPQF